MTTFTSISNALVAVGAKPFATTVQALRDNPIAIAEGDPTAPKINQGALERLSPGSEIRSRLDAEAMITSATIQVRHSFQFMQVGEIRVTFDHRSRSDADIGRALVRRVRNGVTTELASFNNVRTYVSRQADVTVIPGDTIQICWVTASNIDVFIRNARFQTNGENLWTGLSQLVEGNTYA